MKRWTILISAMALMLFSGLATASDRGKFKRREFQHQYREILQRYSVGDAAADALIEAETAVAAKGDMASVEQMRKAEIDVVEEIVPAGVEVLQPIIALHEKAYFFYRSRKGSILIPHARAMVVELIEIFARHARSIEDRTTASDLMTCMAGHLQEARVDSVATGLYRRALELDSDNATALIGLSFLHEQYGEYSDAVRYLETLVEIDPPSGAAELRLGVNLVRMDLVESGTLYLRGVLNDGNPSWMRSVAYQELARILTDRDELAEARSLLEEGVRTLPDDPSLLIQLAYLAERNGSHSEDPALRLALRRSDHEGPGSARYRYSQLPEKALDELRRRLERQADDQRGLLATALDPGSHTKRAREGAQ